MTTTKTPQTIASLVREAARNETAFFATLNEVLDDDAPERLEEFFAKLNIPRSANSDDSPAEVQSLPENQTLSVTTFAQEMHITDGIQKFLDRHMRKLKWHVAHPSIDGAKNCVRLYRAMATVTELRIRRIIALLEANPSVTAQEWGNARELLNRAYREIREATSIVTGSWLEALGGVAEPAEIKAALADFPDVVANLVQVLRDLRDTVEARRQEMEVRPDGYPPVRPPRYFGGDLLDISSWRYFWGDLSAMADNLRNNLDTMA